jgi:hypothetical protein
VVDFGVAVLLGEEENTDGERGVEASTVARSSGSRWPEARAIARQIPCCGRCLRLAVALARKQAKSSSRRCHRDAQERNRDDGTRGVARGGRGSHGLAMRVAGVCRLR